MATQVVTRIFGSRRVCFVSCFKCLW